MATNGSDENVHDGEAHRLAFDRLFQYISGQNELDAKIDMTGPVSIRISNTANAEGKFDFSMAFYIPEAFQESPVQPTNERVYIEERPAFEVRNLKTFPS